MKPLPLILGAAAAVALALGLSRRASAAGRGRVVDVRVTKYYPTGPDASEKEKRMEGGPEGAASWRGKRVVDPRTGRRVRLRTLEQHLEDGEPFSIAGDPGVWPFGQLLRIKWLDGRVVEGRVVDTGSHFTGSERLVREPGREPLDVRVASKSTKIPERTTVEVVTGDNWDPGREVAFEKAGRSSVVGALNMLGVV